MKSVRELRVGVCDCSPTYHGMLEGKIIKVAGEEYKMREITIDDRNPSEEAYRTRCHFSLDVHPIRLNGKKMFDTFVLRNDEFYRTKKGWKLLAGDIRQSIRKSPAKLRTIFGWMKDLVSEMSQKQRSAWLNNDRI